MTELFWRCIAWLFARPKVRDWIVRTATKTPFMHLGGYMHRWWLMPRWMLQPDEKGYLEPKPWVPCAFRLHWIRRADADAALHSHPFPWRTIILKGFYIEEDVWGNHKVYMEGDTRKATIETLHRIDRVCERGVLTLFIMGRKNSESWGFMTGDPPRLVHHSKYRSPNNRTMVAPPPINLNFKYFDAAEIAAHMSKSRARIRGESRVLQEEELSSTRPKHDEI